MRRIQTTPLYLATTLFALTMIAACAKVPEQSVTLSVNVGESLEELRQKNADLVSLLFRDRRKMVNDFVDTVYAPYVINMNLTTEQDYEKNGQEISMLNLILKHGEKGEEKEAFDAMYIVVTALIDDIQSMRAELLRPIETQEQQVKRAFDNAFGIVIQGNETTTGLLRSIRQVHSAQDRFLQDIGIGKDLRGKTHSAFADASQVIEKILDDAQGADSTLDKISAECKKAEDEVQCKIDKFKLTLE